MFDIIKETGDVKRLKANCGVSGENNPNAQALKPAPQHWVGVPFFRL
jgi:hypothetical protein